MYASFYVCNKFSLTYIANPFRLCIASLSLTQGSHRSPKVLNVLEFDFSIRVPSNVLEFH